MKIGPPKNPFAKEVKDHTMSIRVTNEARDTLEAVAESVGITPNRYLAKLLEIHLEELAREGKLPGKTKSKRKGD